MANTRNPKRRGYDTSRDQGGFVAIPWSVLDCPAYGNLSHPARSLLMEFARQFVRDNNGRLLASGVYLAKRGWKSSDVIVRAKRELIEAGFIFETVMGHRPNKASWYAVTWRALDKITGYDQGTEQLFERGAYRKKPAHIGTVLTPSGGVGVSAIAPSGGVESTSPTPSGGAIRATFDHSSTPSHGNHLDMPSTALDSTACLPGCPAPRLPAARTLIGRVLHRARPATKPAGYHAARSRFLQVVCLEGAHHA